MSYLLRRAIQQSLIRPILFMPLIDNLDLVIGTGAATFTRSTIATFINKDSGLLETASIDAARFESEGVLLEGASTNLFLWSEELERAEWARSQTGAGSVPTVGADAGIAPDGTATADNIVFTIDSDISADRSIFRQSVTTSSGSTQSIWLKSNTGLEQEIFFHLAGNTEAQITVTAEWQRFEGFTSFVGTALWGLEFRGGQGAASLTSDILVWGAQLEGLPLASSYIRTLATSVTRASDNLSIDAANIPAPTADYSVSADADILGSLDTDQVLFWVVGESLRFLRVTSIAAAQPDFRSGAASATSPNVFPLNTPVKITGTVDVSGGISLYEGGALEDTTAYTTDPTGTKTSILIGQRDGTTRYLFGHVKDLKFFDVNLTASQVAAL